MTTKEIFLGAVLTVVTGVVLLFAEKYILHDGEAPPSPVQVSQQADPPAMNIPKSALNAPPQFLNNPPPAQKVLSVSLPRLKWIAAIRSITLRIAHR